jgi:aminomethyltransferase
MVIFCVVARWGYLYIDNNLQKKEISMPINTPFQGVHEQFNARFAEYDGWSMPADFGDVEGELKSLADNCVAYDLSSFGRISVSGTAAGEVIDELLTDKTGDLEDEKWVWGLINGENTVRVSLTDGKYTIFCSPGKRDSLLEMVNKIAREGTIIDDITEKTGILGIYGLKAEDIVEKILPFDISDIGEGGIRNISFFMMNITVIRGSWAGTKGFEIMCPKGACGMAAAAVGKYRDRENIAAGGMESLNIAMGNAKKPF